MKNPIDLADQEIQVGDLVVFNPPQYKGVYVGTVIRFTPKMVTISYPWGKSGTRECNRRSGQVLKLHPDQCIGRMQRMLRDG